MGGERHFWSEANWPKMAEKEWGCRPRAAIGVGQEDVEEVVLEDLLPAFFQNRILP